MKNSNALYLALEGRVRLVAAGPKSFMYVLCSPEGRTIGLKVKAKFAPKDLPVEGEEYRVVGYLLTSETDVPYVEVTEAIN